MASVNKTILIGNLGRDPELRYFPSGGAVCNVSIATTRSWKDKTSGERKEETEWHKVTFMDKLAEVAGQYLKKGAPVYVEGRLKTRKWTDKDGCDNYTTEIIAEQMQMLGGRDQQAEDTAPRQSSAPRPPVSRAPGAAAAYGSAKPETAFDDMDSDVPF